MAVIDDVDAGIGRHAGACPARLRSQAASTQSRQSAVGNCRTRGPRKVSPAVRLLISNRAFHLLLPAILVATVFSGALLALVINPRLLEEVWSLLALAQCCIAGVGTVLPGL
jgi:hypothetical protein